MARIKIRYRQPLAALTGLSEETAEAASVKDALRHIKKRYGPEAGKKAKAMLIAVNGLSILKLKLYRTPLEEGDELSFMPICGGG
jgi:molybdopterin converting factor small subunit